MFWTRIYGRKLLERENSVRGSRIREPGLNNVSKKRKVGQMNDGQGEDRVKRKRRVRRDRGVGVVDNAFDRISELPDPIIHLIFAFLRCPKDVARTRVLSKRWKGVFDSYLTFDFDETYFRVKGVKGKHDRIKARETQKKRFNKYVADSLATRLKALPCIDKFRLNVKNMDGLRWACMDRWICSALDKNVKELEICVVNGKCYPMPDIIFGSTSLTCLKLSGGMLNHGPVQNLCNLKILSLKETMASISMIKKIAEYCPMIEDLRLVRCTGPTGLFTLAFAKLRRLEVHECPHIMFLEIEAPNLETFWYHAKRDNGCEFHLKDCGNLKNLTLKDGKMTDKMLQECLSRCSLLENLVIQECSKLERLTILSQKLNRLSLIKCEKLHEANIDAPNLYSFHYSGRGLPLSSMKVLGLREAKLFFSSYWNRNQLFVDNHKFFKDFVQHNGLKLITYSKKTMTIFEEPIQAGVVWNTFNKVELCASSTSVLKIVDTWLRECQGEHLSVISPRDELLKATGVMLNGRDGNPNCCRLYKKKCWRHYLADVKTIKSSFVHEARYEFKWKKIATEEC